VCGPLNSERREGDESSVPDLEEALCAILSFFFSFLELDASLTFFSHAFFLRGWRGFLFLLGVRLMQNGGKHVDG
jgi:hypothetical protein